MLHSETPRLFSKKPLQPTPFSEKYETHKDPGNFGKVCMLLWETSSSHVLAAFNPSLRKVGFRKPLKPAPPTT